ncbi:hypothetical protein HDU86_006463 [Geranomyces michiganensis]|nr:hypothetical protein HDU86_006463 [Geranomyces michiganensis]
MIGDTSLSYAWPTTVAAPSSPFADSTSLAVKVSLDGTIRRFSLISIDHTELVATVRTLYGLSQEVTLSLSWIDEEGDECRLDHEPELAEAARCARRNAAGLLKLHGHIMEQGRLGDLFTDDISDSDDSDDEAHPGLPGAFYTAIPPHNALIREIEESEMEEGLLPAAVFTNGDLWSKSVSCQHEASSVRPMGTQATTSTHEQSIQVNLISLTSATASSTAPRCISTRTVSTETPRAPSVTTTNMGTQCDHTNYIVAKATQDRETQHFAAASTTAVDVRCGPDGDSTEVSNRRYKTVGFSHSVKIPSIVEEEDELSHSPYPHDESDEENEELLSNEEGDEEEEVMNSSNVTSPGEFVMV